MSRREIVAITRSVSATIERGLRTHLGRAPIDVALARRQHAAYVALLASLGARIVPLDELPDAPDAVFVEDNAVVLDDLAIVTRVGAAERRVERDSVAAALEPFRDVVRLEAPATVDGGDVLRIGRTIYVGHSGRTNAAGIAELERLASVYGYTIVPVRVTGALHLKSACTWAGGETVVVNSRWIADDPFRHMDRVEVGDSEPWGANVLRVGGAVVVGAAFPRTADALAERGLTVERCDASELAKAEGALTCMSILVETKRGEIS